jgi:hypothetical protein
VAACISRSVMNNSVSSTVIMEYSKQNESYRYWLDLPLLVCVRSYSSLYFTVGVKSVNKVL